MPDVTISVVEIADAGRCAIPALKQYCERVAKKRLKVVHSKDLPSGCFLNTKTWAYVWNEENESDITPEVAYCTPPPSGMDETIQNMHQKYLDLNRPN